MGNSEYEKIKELRRAVAALPYAQSQLKNVEKMQDQCRQRLVDSQNFLRAPKPQVCTKYTSRVKAEFEKEARELDAVATQKARNKVKRKNSRVSAAIVFPLILVAFIVFGLIAYLAYIVGKWNWDTSITAMVADNLTYKTSVGILLFYLAISLLIAFGIIFGLFNLFNSDFVDGPGIVVIGVICIGLSVVSFIASFVYYYADISGFFGKLGHFFMAFAYNFFYIVHFFKTLLFALCVALAIGGTGGLLYLAHRLRTMDSIDTQGCSEVEVKDAINALDYGSLYASDIYKEAKQLDEELGKLETKKKIDYHKNVIEAQEQYIISYRNEIQKYQNIINNCNNIIKNATFIHPSYKNTKSLDIIIYYFEYNRATTLVKAINEYVHDQQYLNIINKLDEIRRAQYDAMNRAVDIITKRMNSMQNAITSEIADARRATEQQTQVINDNFEKSRQVYEKSVKEQERNAQARADSFNSRFDQMIANQSLSNRILNDQYNAILKK